jgi:hypothetical protein
MVGVRSGSPVSNQISAYALGKHTFWKRGETGLLSPVYSHQPGVPKIINAAELTMAKQLFSQSVVVQTAALVLVSRSVRAATRALSDIACPALPASRTGAVSR